MTKGICKVDLEALTLSEDMHNWYEQISLLAGWDTQKKCQVPFEDLPRENQLVMLSVARKILDKYVRNSQQLLNKDKE